MFYTFIKSLYPLFKVVLNFFYRVLFLTKIKNMDYSIQCDGLIDVSGSVSVGKNSRIGRDSQFQANMNGAVEIGENVRINRGCTVVSYSSVKIGNHSLIGEYVSIRDANHGTSLSDNIKSQQHTTKPVVIGSDVWIGRGSCILPGVTIGSGSVIGANSVVTKNIPSNSVVAGVPGKIIKKRK